MPQYPVKLMQTQFYLDGQEDDLKAGRKPGDAGYGVEAREKHGTLTTMTEGTPSSSSYPTAKPLTYATFYKEFADALNGKGEVPVKPDGPAEVIRLIEMARQSSVDGKTLTVW